MLKKVRNNKGFTLIELLAVIVILGVLMIITIPMVSQYLRDARKNAMLDIAKSYVNSARYAFLNGNYVAASESINGGLCTGVAGGDVYINFKNIKMDNDDGTSDPSSPFGGTIDREKSYIHIKIDASGDYTYSVAIVDTLKNGISESKVTDLKKSLVVANVTLESPTVTCNFSDIVI